MASIRDYAITINAAVTASMVCEMPEHASGDLLVAFVNKDTASNFTTPSGWTAQQTQTSAGAAGGVYTKRAASSSEAVTFALTSETCCAVVISVQNVNGTTDADAVSGSAKSGADDSTLPLGGVGITPSHNNCLILHGLSTDSGIGANALPPWINLFAGDAGANSLCVSYTQQKTAAAISAPSHWAGTADDSRGFIIAIRDDGNGNEFDCYLPVTSTPSRQITPLNGSSGTVDKGTYTAAASITLTTINGKTVTGVTAGTAVADSGINPFRGSANFPGVSSRTNLGHTEFVLTATDDLTQLEGLVFGTWQNVAPRDYVDTGTAAQGGKYLVVGNDASNYRAWVIGGQFTKTEVADGRNNYLIEVGTSDTIYGSAGSPGYSTADFFAFGTAGYYGAAATRWNEMYLLGVSELVGGSSSSPFGFEDIVFVVNNGNGILPLMQQAGALATCWQSLKFGGSDPCHVACNLNTFQYPRKADEVDYVNFHVSNNKVGIEFDGQDRGSGDVDTLHFTNCLFTSPSPYYWRFASTHDAGADIDFTGSSIVGATVTLRSTVSISNVTFIDCASFTQNSATLTSCSFQNTKVTSTDLDLFDACDFTSSGTGHAVDLGTIAASDTMGWDCTATGYAISNGTTGNETIRVSVDSGQTLTINVASGATTPSIKNDGTGSVSVVVAPATLTITVLDVSTGSPIENARAYVTAAAGGGMTVGDVIIDKALTNASGQVSDTRSYGSNQPITGRVRKSSASPYYKEAPVAGTVSSSSGLSLTIQMIPDE